MEFNVLKKEKKLIPLCFGLMSAGLISNKKRDAYENKYLNDSEKADSDILKYNSNLWNDIMIKCFKKDKL